MSKQLYSLHGQYHLKTIEKTQVTPIYIKKLVLRVDVHKEEWDRVRKRLIGKVFQGYCNKSPSTLSDSLFLKLPIYGSMPNIYLKISLGKESRKTKPVQNCLSPTWDEQIIL